MRIRRRIPNGRKFKETSTLLLDSSSLTCESYAMQEKEIPLDPAPKPSSKRKSIIDTQDDRKSKKQEGICWQPQKGKQEGYSVVYDEEKQNGKRGKSANEVQEDMVLIEY